MDHHKPDTDDDSYIQHANTRSTHFQPHTSPPSFDGPPNKAKDAELSQLVRNASTAPLHHRHHHPLSSSQSSRWRFSNSKRRKIQLLVISLSLLSTGLLLGAVLGSNKGGELVRNHEDLAVGQCGQVSSADPAGGNEEDGYEDLEVYLKNGNATNGFLENLRDEWMYVTTWNSAGMTNVFEGYCNLIYLALITQRIPIIPPLVPSPTHLGFGEPLPFLNFGKIFDLPRLRRALRSPILEWKDVKRAHYEEPWLADMPPVDGVVKEELGCWSTIQIIRGRRPHRPELEPFLELDVAYTPVPLSVALPRFLDQSTFWGLAYLTFEEGRRTAFEQDKDVVPGQTLHSRQVVEPDAHLACFDDLYFTNAVDGFEWEKDVSPGWRFVGVHVRWNKWVEEVAVQVLKSALGVPESGEVPPFIAVHIRRDDFDAWFCESHPEAECYPPLPVFRNRVRQVQEALAEKFGAATQLGNVQNVIVTSDEKNATWWEEVNRMGWRHIDHKEERTAERYGRWYPSIIDAAIQSMGIGFVGTQRSTMSRVAALRVRDWNGGVTRMVQWNEGKGE